MIPLKRFFHYFPFEKEVCGCCYDSLLQRKKSGFRFVLQFFAFCAFLFVQKVLLNRLLMLPGL